MRFLFYIAMNITFILSRFLNGGIDTVVLRYIEGLIAQGHHCTLCIAYGYGDMEMFTNDIPHEAEVVYLVENGPLTKLRRKKMIKHLSLKEKLWDELFLNHLRRRRAAKAIKPIMAKSDVVIDFDSCNHNLLYPYFGKKKTIAFFHFSPFHYHWGIKKRMDRTARHLADYDRVVCICQQMVEEMQLGYPKLKDKISCIYNPINTEEVLRKAAIEPDESDKLPSEYILSVSRLEEIQKDTTTLIKGYTLACCENDNIADLVIIGDGIDRESLERLSESTGFGEKIHFLGFKKNPMPYIKKAKALVLSTHFEGSPVIIIEAQAIGTPCISTDCSCGPRETLINGEAGLLVKESDIISMKEALIRIDSDASFRECIKTKAKEAISRYDIKSRTSKLEALINSI